MYVLLKQEVWLPLALEGIDMTCLFVAPFQQLSLFGFELLGFRGHLMDFKNNYIIKCI